jgi:hypothetical protein
MSHFEFIIKTVINDSLKNDYAESVNLIKHKLISETSNVLNWNLNQRKH